MNCTITWADYFLYKGMLILNMFDGGCVKYDVRWNPVADNNIVA